MNLPLDAVAFLISGIFKAIDVFHFDRLEIIHCGFYYFSNAFLFPVS